MKIKKSFCPCLRLKENENNVIKTHYDSFH